jgi:hypothetical protein
MLSPWLKVYTGICSANHHEHLVPLGSTRTMALSCDVFYEYFDSVPEKSVCRDGNVSVYMFQVEEHWTHGHEVWYSVPLEAIPNI